jgi:hypothetical protein
VQHDRRVVQLRVGQEVAQQVARELDAASPDEDDTGHRVMVAAKDGRGWSGLDVTAHVVGLNPDHETSQPCGVIPNDLDDEIGDLNGAKIASWVVVSRHEQQARVRS